MSTSDEKSLEYLYCVIAKRPLAKGRIVDVFQKISFLNFAIDANILFMSSGVTT